ncbi:3-dehydroquinate dehydratase [Candidatus Tremblaya phenacola PAVE]|nr:3-dehydroquinate dehydratase [Candidatus Tremblaya phenacola PAVE]
MKKVLVLNGPNLNLLGMREKEVYGSNTLANIARLLIKESFKRGLLLCSFQSNSEDEMIRKIQHSVIEGIDFILINPASFTHTSIGIRDSLVGTAIPFLEVHLSNINSREKFRSNSVLSDVAIGSIIGLGWKSYLGAIFYVVEAC